MDFKLVAGESRLQARSILTNQKRLLAKGVIVTYAPKNPDDQIKCTRLNVVLREKKIEELLEISKKQSKENKEDKEIHRFLKVLETKKNCSYFAFYFFV